MSIIIYGPQGCGKSRHAEALARHFGCRHIVDGIIDPYPRTRVDAERLKLGDTLILTQTPPPYPIDASDRRILHFDRAMAALRQRADRRAHKRQAKPGRREVRG